MKHILTILLLFTSTIVYSQVLSEEVATGGSNQVFYNLDNGVVKSVSNVNWHLAVKGGLLGGTVRSNVGLTVYNVDDLDYWDFPAVMNDTAYTAYSEISNSTKEWRLGAFNTGGDPEFAFEYGWGEYSQGNGIFASRFFIIGIQVDAQTIYKQFAIEKMQAGNYYFKWADLDGSNLDSMTVSKADFSNTDYGYVNLLTKEVTSERPSPETWDLVFTRYKAAIQAGPELFYYPVAGVLSGPNLWSVQLNDVEDPLTVEEPDDIQYSPEIDIIGHDWKDFDLNSGNYLISEDTVYFVQRYYVDGESFLPTGEVYKIMFTDYAGGTHSFDIEAITTGSINENGRTIASFAIANNIITSGENINVIYSLSAQNATMELFDVNGNKYLSREINSTNGLSNLSLNSNGLTTGMYFLRLNVNGSISTEKLIIQ